MTNEDYLQLIQLGSENDELTQQIALQKEQAKYLRSGGAPEARQAGRVTVAPHWMELLGRLAQESVAAKKMRGVETSQKTMTANRAKQNEMIMRALIAQKQMQQNQNQPISGTGMNPTVQGQGQGMTPPPNFSY